MLTLGVDVHTMWGPQDSVQLPYKLLNSMVYSRYNELVNRVINQFITGGHHFVVIVAER
jgi:hypothetical protein